MKIDELGNVKNIKMQKFHETTKRHSSCLVFSLYYLC
jgi:hypothetical protein